jgi:enoyl-CoA hydratase/carnithine racemase
MEIGDFQDILYEKDPETGIVTITFNRPERKNALSLVTFLELARALEVMGADPEARVLILTGRGEAFSSGGYFNLAFMQSLPPEVLSQIDVTEIAQKKVCLKFWEFDKPVIAAVNGLAKQAFHKPLIAEISAALDQENLGLNRAFGSEDFFEALTARMEKRPPRFKGR